jgi:hypothetical protein
MSKSKPVKKKVVVVNKTAPAEKRGTTPARPRTAAVPGPAARELTFGRQTYIWMGGGLALIFLGMLLMLGGHMPSPDVWDPDIIYSTRRTLLAPVLILAGLGVQIFAIFKR